MPMIEHDYQSACFHAYTPPPYVAVYEPHQLGNMKTASPGSHFSGKANYYLSITAPEFALSRLFDMAATKPVKNSEKKQRPIIDRSYYHSEEFFKNLELTMDAALADPLYQAEIEAWHITVGDGLHKGAST